MIKGAYSDQGCVRISNLNGKREAIIGLCYYDQYESKYLEKMRSSSFLFNSLL